MGVGVSDRRVVLAAHFAVRQLQLEYVGLWLEGDSLPTRIRQYTVCE